LILLSGLLPPIPGTSAKATKELEELASVDADDSSDTASGLQVEQDAWLRYPRPKVQLALIFA
jgi:hypothetical protein